MLYKTPSDIIQGIIDDLTDYHGNNLADVKAVEDATQRPEGVSMLFHTYYVSVSDSDRPAFAWLCRLISEEYTETLHKPSNIHVYISPSTPKKVAVTVFIGFESEQDLAYYRLMK